jgi:hypothetical protein
MCTLECPGSPWSRCTGHTNPLAGILLPLPSAIDYLRVLLRIIFTAVHVAILAMTECNCDLPTQ